MSDIHPSEMARSAPDRGAAERAVAAVWRIESARIMATLTRMVGDFGLAEDLAQEALVDALRQWPVDGVPRNAAAWLTAVAKRKAIDGWRRRERLDDRIAVLAHDLEREQDEAAEALPWDPDAVDDDVLRLVFISCHPVLSREAQVALTLRVVGGLSSEEIARAFLVPVATVQQRIVRAKKTLGAANVPFEMPPREEHADRLGAVLGVLYLIFNEGHAASSGADWMRPELSVEAIRLARILAALMPKERDVHSLLALMELTAARFPARVDADGEPVLLADQDRRRWDRGRIARGRAALATADAVGTGRGPYGLQAAIAECHAVAASVEETDWERIVLLYEALGRIAPSPVVELNRAAAVAMATGPASARASSTRCRPRGHCAGTTCCRPHAARCCSGSDGRRRRAASSPSPRVSPGTTGSAPRSRRRRPEAERPAPFGAEAAEGDGRLRRRSRAMRDRRGDHSRTRSPRPTMRP